MYSERNAVRETFPTHTTLMHLTSLVLSSMVHECGLVKKAFLTFSTLVRSSTILFSMARCKSRGQTQEFFTNSTCVWYLNSTHLLVDARALIKAVVQMFTTSVWDSSLVNKAVLSDV